MVNKANTSKSVPEDESALGQDAKPDFMGMEVPSARPVRQRQRSPTRPLAAGIPAQPADRRWTGVTAPLMPDRK